MTEVKDLVSRIVNTPAICIDVEVPIQGVAWLLTIFLTSDYDTDYLKLYFRFKKICELGLSNQLLAIFWRVLNDAGFNGYDTINAMQCLLPFQDDLGIVLIIIQIYLIPKLMIKNFAKLSQNHIRKIDSRKPFPSLKTKIYEALPKKLRRAC